MPKVYMPLDDIGTVSLAATQKASYLLSFSIFSTISLKFWIEKKSARLHIQILSQYFRNRSSGQLMYFRDGNQIIRESILISESNIYLAKYRIMLLKNCKEDMNRQNAQIAHLRLNTTLNNYVSDAY